MRKDDDEIMLGKKLFSFPDILAGRQYVVDQADTYHWHKVIIIDQSDSDYWFLLLFFNTLCESSCRCRGHWAIWTSGSNIAAHKVL